MNIFKILASGSGNVSETNISAFLGYLLNPNEDHGLGYTFLERFLESQKSNLKLENFKTRMFEYEVLLEKSIENKNSESKTKSEIIDVIILCYDKSQAKEKRNISEILIEENRVLKNIFLIENKIKDFLTVNQLLNQYNSVEKFIKKNGNNEIKICSIYITPEAEKFKLEFNSFKSETKAHFFWKSEVDEGNYSEAEIIPNHSDKDNNKSIYSILLDLVEQANLGKIEAINDYTKHTIISFIQFIKNDFKSLAIEKQENLEGKYKRTNYSTLNDYLESGTNLTLEAKEQLINFYEYLRNNHNELDVKHYKTQFISVYFNKKKIFSISDYSNNQIKYEFETLSNNNVTIDNLGSILRSKIKDYSDDNRYDYSKTCLQYKKQISDENLILVFEEYLKLFE